MVILVIRRLVWGITNRGSTVNKYILYIYYPLAELNFKHFTYKKLCISLIFSKLEVSNNKILKIRYAQLEYNIT